MCWMSCGLGDFWVWSWLTRVLVHTFRWPVCCYQIKVWGIGMAGVVMCIVTAVPAGSLYKARAT